MFDSLSEKLDRVLKRLRGQGVLTEQNVAEALSEVRMALLEADVNFKIVKDFIERVREKALGREHPNVANTSQNLAELYRAAGRYAEAEPLYQRALAIRAKALGPEHPDVANSLDSLAVLSSEAGRYAEAVIDFFARVMTGRWPAKGSRQAR